MKEMLGDGWTQIFGERMENRTTEFGDCVLSPTEYDLIQFGALCVCICVIICCCCTHSIAWFVLLRRARKAEKSWQIARVINLFSGGNIKPTGYKQVARVGRDTF